MQGGSGWPCSNLMKAQGCSKSFLIDSIFLQGAYNPPECAFRGGFKVDMFETSASACDGFVELGSSRLPVAVGG